MSKSRFIKINKEKKELKNIFLDDSIKKLVESINELNKPIINIVKELQNSFPFKDLEKIRENMLKIGENIKYFNKVAPENLKLLSKYWWYLNNNANATWMHQLPELLKNWKEKEVDKILWDYYISELNNIFNTLYERHPNRKHIFLEIKKSFDNELYYVCCSTILTQIDWICFDLTDGEKFFRSKKKNWYTPDSIIKIKDKLNNTFILEPLLCQTWLIDHEGNLEKYPIRLNRHEILHWVDFNYWTKINTLKLISILIYISDVLEEVKK